MNGRNLVTLPVRHQDCFPYILRLVPALNLAAFKAMSRQDKQVVLWYCMRAIDTAGHGVLDREQAIHILKASFGYQHQTAYKHLQAGNGIYWNEKMGENEEFSQTNKILSITVASEPVLLHHATIGAFVILEEAIASSVPP